MTPASRGWPPLFCALVWLAATGPAAAGAGSEVWPRWTSDRQYRLVVRVGPVPETERRSDELVARTHVDFDRVLDGRPCDLSSLQVVGYDPETSEPIPYPGNPHATTAGDRPFRFYDAAIPWDFPEREGYAHANNGTGLPQRKIAGGGRFLGVLGDGRGGTIAWAHRQEGKWTPYYAIYFNARSPGDGPKRATPGFLGDGSNRCARGAGGFFPLGHSRVELADLNGDGRFDLVVGSMNGTILWYANTGRAGRPAFTDPRLIFTDEGSPLDIGYSSAPRAADWDADGDLDLIVGAEKESFVFFRNTGTVTSPRFHHEGLLRADGKPLRVPKAPCEEDPEGKVFPFDYYPIPDIVDFDGDGDLDLLAGGYITGRIWLYENTAPSPRTEPQLTFRGPVQADGRDIDVTWMASPCCADFDHDGDLDLVSGAMQMTEGGGDKADPRKFLWYYENVATRTSPAYALRSFPARGAFSHGALATPRAVDFNDDGRLDLVVSAGTDLLFLPNVGEPNKPVFDATAPAMKPPWGNAPLTFQQLVDYDHDGWPDLFTGDSIVLSHPKTGARFGGPRTTIRLLEKGARIHHPTPRGDHWDYRSLADLDGDGKLDILCGDHAGHVWFHRDNGTADRPRIDPQGRRLKLDTGALLQVGTAPTPKEANAFDELQGARTTMASADFNRDGRADLVVCDTYGAIRLFLHAAGTEVAFRPGVQLARLVKIRLTSQPVDWNGDGWTDILATYAGGQTCILLNRGGTEVPSFAAPEAVPVPQYPLSWPFLHVADWNHDGDEDILFHYGSMLRFVERSFLAHGYVPGQILRHERKEVSAEPFFERGTVASADHFAWNAFPTVDRLADGRLLCVFSARDPKTRGKSVVAGMFSADHGKTWGAPTVLIDSAGELDYDPNLIVIGSRVLVTSTTCPTTHAHHISTSRTVAVRSDDGGKTWSPPYEIPMGHRYTCGKINPGVMLRDRTALFGYSWDAGLEQKDRRLDGEGQHELVVGVMISRDRGATWAPSRDVRLAVRKSADRKHAINGIDEPAVVELHDGSLYMLARTGLERLYACRSRDGGRTWSPPTPSPLTSHNAPASLCRITGRKPGVLAVWCNSTKDRWPLCVAASFDGARTWTPPRELARQPGLQSSYPGCVQATDGTLVVVWQQDQPSGRREVRSARFNLAWMENE